MDNKLKHTLIVIVMAAVITGVCACGEKAPPPAQSRVVKQKIADQQARPADKADAGQDRKAAALAAAGPATAETGSKDKPVAADKEQAPSELVRESRAIAGEYNPEGRFDPFEPLFKKEPNRAEVSVSKDKRKKRVPQTPLERIALSQLRLTAIMRTPQGNSAIVEDATGKGFVIRKGTYIGLNSGQVTRIGKDDVVIEEEVENVMGELKIQTTELKLQKPAGEL